MRHRLRPRPRPFAASALLVIAAACESSDAREPAHPNPVVFIATKNKLEGPRTTSAGYAMLTFANGTDSLMAHALVRIKNDVTLDSALHAARLFHELEPGDRRASLAAFDAFYGGAVFVPPGQTKGVGVLLSPGRYIAYADVISDGPPRVHDGFITPMEVKASTDVADAPKADHTIRMVDFGFEGPRRVEAGRSRWRVENAGAAVHLAFITRILPGHTYAETKRALLNPEGSPPVEAMAKTLGVHALSRGVYNDVELDLVPGEYAIVCFIEGHHMMGMVSPLTVSPAVREAP
jgi:hypothetical protein